MSEFQGKSSPSSACKLNGLDRSQKQKTVIENKYLVRVAKFLKPGLPYLDILFRVKDTFGMPTFAYQVSGEYAMIMAAAERGFIDGDKAMLESLISLKRAGADAILTYFAPRVVKVLKGVG